MVQVNLIKPESKAVYWKHRIKRGREVHQEKSETVLRPLFEPPLTLLKGYVTDEMTTVIVQITYAVNMGSSTIRAQVLKVFL